MSRRLTLLAGMLVVVLLPSASPAAAGEGGGVQPKTGDIFVVDSRPSGLGGIIRVKPSTGNRKIVSDNATVAGSPTFSQAFFLAMEADGSLVTTGAFVQNDGNGYSGVIRVNPNTGARSAISLSSSSPTAGDAKGFGPAFESPEGIAVESTGKILVVNQHTGDILRIDPNSGDRTILSTNATSSPQFLAPEDIALAPDGHPHVVDISGSPLPAGGGAGSVFRIDPVTGSHFVLSSNFAPANGTKFDTPFGLAVDSFYNTYVGNRGPTRENIDRLDPAGVRTAIGDNFVPSNNPKYDEINDLTLAQNEKTIISTQFGHSIGQVLRTRISDGKRTLVTDDNNPPGLPSTGRPWGVAVYPITVTHFVVGRAERQGPIDTNRASAARSSAIGTFSYRLKQRARAVITIARRKGHTFKVVGKLKQAAKAGRNRRAFTGKFGKHKLPAGRYRAILNLSDAAGNESVPVSVDFRIA